MVLGFGVVSWRLTKDRRRVAPVKEQIRREAVIYKAPIKPYWKRGRWSMGGYVNGMQLVVREHSFELSYPFPGGSFLTPEWFCAGNHARMWTDTGNWPPPRVRRNCIVLTVPSIEHSTARQEISISSWRHQLREAWDALVLCGVWPMGTPPEFGS